MLPVYNGAKYVAGAIASLLSQSERPEIIISDDCSIDETCKIVRSFGADHITLLENPARGGQFVNFNRAIKAARGEFIQLFSHDDFAYPEFLAAQLDSICKHPRVGLTYASCNMVDANGTQLAICDDNGTPELIDFKTYLDISSRHGSLPPSVSCVMVRRSTLGEVGAFDERFAVAGDLELYNRAAERFPLSRNRVIALDVRVHSESVTSSRSTPVRFMWEEIDILSFYKRHLSNVEFREMLRERARSRGADHAKFILRAFSGGRFADGRAAYHALSQVHNVPVCVFHALAQRLSRR